MRHKRQRGRLSRTTSERRALLRSLVTALFKHQRIVTTVQKAKAARRLAEKMITIAKNPTVANQRRLFAILTDRTMVRVLVTEVTPRFKNRQSGYTRILKLPTRRKGDNAEMAIFELTELKAVEQPEKKAKKKAPEHKHEKPVKEEPHKEGEARTPEAKKEEPKHVKEEKRHPGKGDMRPHEKTPKAGFMHGLKRFLKPKTGT